jgi:hypothetical protein
MNRRGCIDSSFLVADTSVQFFKEATVMPATNTIGEQVLEAVVTGPDGANRLFTCTGIANVQMSLTRTQEQATETWTFLVGPSLPRPQFYRAIGTASVSLQTVDIQRGASQLHRSRRLASRPTGTMNPKGSRCALKSWSVQI